MTNIVATRTTSPHSVFGTGETFAVMRGGHVTTAPYYNVLLGVWLPGLQQRVYIEPWQ